MDEAKRRIRTGADGFLGPWFESRNLPATHRWNGLKLAVAVHRLELECSNASNPWRYLR
jgi:hypothetical protein